MLFLYLFSIWYMFISKIFYCYCFPIISSGKSNNTLESMIRSNVIRRRGFTALHDSMTDIEIGKKEIYYYNELSSTMDKAKELGFNLSKEEIFAVVAEQQTNGRGTRGRVWLSGANNLLISISIPLSLIKIPLTLCPLR